MVESNPYQSNPYEKPDKGQLRKTQDTSFNAIE
jgi:hypothetical protein